jgi:hypothetical protein
VTVSARTTRILTVVGAVAVLVSGWVHFALYFRGGYRGIAPEAFAGITISRAFAINALAALVIAEALVLSLRFPRLLLAASLAGSAFAASTLVAYGLSRTSGLLGFEETATTTKAVIGATAEIVALVSLTPLALAGATTRRHRPTRPTWTARQADADADSAAPASSASA